MAVLLLTSTASRGQGQVAQPRAPAPTPRELAPIDLTGYWVSVITEDWRYRMVAAPKGDHPGLPLSAEGNRIANAWDPAKDEAAGEILHVEIDHAKLHYHARTDDNHVRHRNRLARCSTTRNDGGGLASGWNPRESTSSSSRSLPTSNT
jgi:hypothetical protein